MPHLEKYNFAESLEEIISRVRLYYPRFDKKQEGRIRKAFQFGRDSHQGQFRKSGDEYFTHPVEATKILLSINPDIETILACLLHDVIEDTPVTAEDIEKEFGKDVRFLCEGVEKISKVQLKKIQGYGKYENVQKLFVAVAKDIRIIFIKLADRIHNLSTLQHLRTEKAERIAHESIEIYAPVAQKLGLFEFKSEIENHCFRMLHPEEFKILSKEIAACRKVRKKFIERGKREILKLFEQEKFGEVHVFGREKTLHSVYEKMKRKNYHSVYEVYDLLGIRIIVKTKEDCYRALGVVHTHWRPIPGRFKDYISVGKPNGYQSLHTTVLGLAQSSMPTEIQIRTEQMDLDAEHGPAAHWAYKKAKSSNFDEDYLRRASWFPENIPVEKQMDPEKFFEEISNSIFSDQVYVFTPRGDIKILPKDSTPVDFAYAVHTEVGNSCVGATVNGIIKPLNYRLQNNDVVNILTKVGRKPNPLWINFVKSSSARNRIQSVLNREKLEEENVLSVGKKLASDFIEKAKKKLKMRVSVGIPKTKKDSEIVIGGESGISYKFSPCCRPKPGKPIVAYKSRGLQFTIHEASCPELSRLEPERFLEAHFVTQRTIEVKAYDRIGLSRDYSVIVANHGIRIKDLAIKFSSSGKKVTWTATLAIGSDKELERVLGELRRVDGVYEANVIS